MTVTRLKTAERLAPTPRVGTQVHAIYTALEALGGRATCREIRELLPAANGPTLVNNMTCHHHLKSLGVTLGYIDCDTRFTSWETVTEKQYGDVVYFINTFDVYESKRIERLSQASKARKKRTVAAKKRKAAAQKKTEEQAKQEVEARISAARKKLTGDSTNSTSVDPRPVTSEPAPVTREHKSSTMEQALIAAASSFISVTVYVVLEQIL